MTNCTTSGGSSICLLERCEQLDVPLTAESAIGFHCDIPGARSTEAWQSEDRTLNSRPSASRCRPGTRRIGQSPMACGVPLHARIARTNDCASRARSTASVRTASQLVAEVQQIRKALRLRCVSTWPAYQLNANEEPTRCEATSLQARAEKRLRSTLPLTFNFPPGEGWKTITVTLTW